MLANHPGPPSGLGDCISDFSRAISQWWPARFGAKRETKLCDGHPSNFDARESSEARPESFSVRFLSDRRAALQRAVADRATSRGARRHDERATRQAQPRMPHPARHSRPKIRQQEEEHALGAWCLEELGGRCAPAVHRLAEDHAEQRAEHAVNLDLRQPSPSARLSEPCGGRRNIRARRSREIFPRCNLDLRQPSTSARVF